MPRSGRGGRRQGAPGKAYGNRTDLNAAKPLPPTAAPSAEYGQATAALNAQRALPMAAAPTNAPGAASPSPAPGGNPAAAPPPVTGLPPGLPPPGSMQPLDAPTDRPDEHMMTGVPAGPGPGPEALTPLIAHPLVSGVAALNALGSSVTPQLKALRDAASAAIGNRSVP